MAPRCVPARVSRWRGSWWQLLLGLLLALLAVSPARADSVQGAEAVDAVRTATPAAPGGAAARLPHDMVGAPSGALPAAPEAYDTYNGGWVRFAFPPTARPRVQPLIAEADAARERFRQIFGYPVLNDVTVYVARSAEEM